MDYIIIKTYYKNHAKWHTVQCSKCGHIKEISDDGYQRAKLLCNGTNCKEDYYNKFTGKIFGNYIVDKVDKHYCEMHCLVCNTKEIITTQALLKANKGKESYKHGVRCIKNVPDSKIKQSIITRFNDMKQRCNNKNHNNYSNYGARGIQCKYKYAVDLYYDFYDELLEHSKKYGLENSTFDRIDVNGNYEKSNLRIATQSIQSTNTTRKKLFILEKDNVRVLCDNAMEFGKMYNVNGRSIGNVVRGDSKTAGGWRLVRIVGTNENIEEIIKAESVTTKLITT